MLPYSIKWENGQEDSQKVQISKEYEYDTRNKKKMTRAPGECCENSCDLGETDTQVVRGIQICQCFDQLGTKIRHMQRKQLCSPFSQ